MWRSCATLAAASVAIASGGCGRTPLRSGTEAHAAIESPAATNTSHAAAYSIGVSVSRGVLYRTVAGARLLLDEYRPSAGRSHPAVVFIHGGGFGSGTRSAFAPGEQAFDATGRALAGQGFATFSIDYRLAPNFPFPAAEQDVLAAIRWVRRNARALGVDPRRVGLFGASAGGNLAALAATAPVGPLDQGERVRGAVSWSGPMDLRSFYPDHQFVAGYLGCPPSSCSGRYRAASPVDHIDRGDPAMLLVNGTTETVPLAQPYEMASKLGAARVTHQLLKIPGHRHAGQYAKAAWLATLRFLRQYVA